MRRRLYLSNEEKELWHQDFNYTNSEQTITLTAGKYKLQCWGACGGNAGDANGGKGGYSEGTIKIETEVVAYIYVGGRGNSTSSVGFVTGGFNGGGHSYVASKTYLGGSGGGGSDIRIGGNSLLHRVIVAGGGGGGGKYNNTTFYNGGFGGGSVAGDGEGTDSSGGAYGGRGGSENSGGVSYYGTNYQSSKYGSLADFGVGGSAYSGQTDYRTVGGGGGWYGGGYSQRAGAGGGSGYVLTSSSYKPTNYALGAEYYLSKTKIKGGNETFPSTSGNQETGHNSSGFVRITKIQ